MNTEGKGHCEGTGTVEAHALRGRLAILGQQLDVKSHTLLKKAECKSTVMLQFVFMRCSSDVLRTDVHTQNTAVV